MNWINLMIELCKTCPDSYSITHVEVNPSYQRIGGKEVRVSVDFDTIIFEFTGKYKGKYMAKVRVWDASIVTASIEINDVGVFDYPVTNEDHFDKRMDLYGPSAVNNNSAARNEIEEIYDWTISAYRNLL